MKCLYSLICFLLISLAMFAQKGMIGCVTSDDGLSGGNVSAIFKDSQGFVYFGTSAGIDRFDGSNVVNINFPQSENGDVAWVLAIVEEDSEHLIVGNIHGLWRFDKRALVLSPIFKDDIDCEVTSLQKSTNGIIYVGTVKGVFALSRGNSLSRLHLAGRGNSDVSVMDLSLVKVRGRDVLWVALRHGIIRYMKGTSPQVRYYPCHTVRGEGQVKRIAASDDGRVFVGTVGDGMLSLNPVDGKLTPYMFDGDEINDLLCVKGSLLVATELHGAYEVSLEHDSVTRTYNASTQSDIRIRYNTTSVFYRDNMGVDWFGYVFFGVDYTLYSRHIFSVYSVPGVFDSANYMVRNFLKDGHRMLVGTRNGLYVVDENNRSVKYIGADILKAPLVTFILRCGNRYYVTTIGGGIHVFDVSTLAEISIKGFEAVSKSNVYDIVKDAKGCLWFASSSGLIRIDTTTDDVRVFTTRNSQLPDNEVFCMGFDATGLGWVSTRSGFCNVYVETEEVSTKGIPAPIAALKRLSVILQDGKYTYFVPQIGFPLVYDALFGKSRVMRFALFDNHPVSYFLHRSLKNKYIYATENSLVYGANGALRRFGYLDGLSVMPLQSRNMLVDKNGVFWAATNGGLVYGKTSDMARNDYAHIPIIITEIQTDHWFTPSEVSNVLLDSCVRMSRHINDLSLKFTPLLYANKKGIEFKYKLEGYDDWQMAGHDHLIFFSDLPPGNYSLRIEAVGMSEINATVKVVVPVLYSSMTKFLFLLSVLGLVAYIIWCKYEKKPYFWERFIPKPEKYQKSKLDKEQGKKLARQLVKYMNDDKPYLKSDLQMTDVANALGCSSHVLSQVFSVYLKRNYYDFISEYRVNEFTMIVQNPKYAKYTINTLSELCGFRSRTPFLTAFKKFKGMSPRDYVKSLETDKSK